MNVALNSLLDNTNNYIRTKFVEGSTPLQKKVALFATAFFALAAVGYVIYQFCRKYPYQKETFDPKEKDKPAQATEQYKNNQTDQPDFHSELSEEVPSDAWEVEEGEIVLSAADIAIHNADRLRSLINHYPAEARDPSGQLRTLEFDAEGRLQGIKGPDDNQIWLNDKAKGHHSYQIKISFQKSESIKNAPFVVEDDLGNCPKNIQEIIDSTLTELNQLANGAFHIAKSDNNLPARPDTPKWLTVLDNVKDYPSSSLLVNFQEIDDKKPRLDPVWINDNPNTSLKDLGLSDYDKLQDFITEHGAELKCLNLYGQIIENDQFKQLLKSCPNLTQLFINSSIIEDNDLEHLKGMPLTSASFNHCWQLTDKALEHLKGMQLTSVKFIGSKLTDKALEHLKGMPLTSVDFSWCGKLTDKTFEHLKGMPLTSVNFNGCSKLTDNALEHLKGMPLTSVDFSVCDKLTDKALEHFIGMQLTSVNFSRCDKLTDKALEHLKGMPLTSVNFILCEKLTDKALEHLKGMPLTSVNFSLCEKLTDKALEHLKGMPLTSVSFNWCDKLTDKALEHLKGMQLTSVNFSRCDKLTDKALEHLKGMPLTHAKFGECPKLTPKALAELKAQLIV